GMRFLEFFTYTDQGKRPCGLGKFPDVSDAGTGGVQLPVLERLADKGVLLGIRSKLGPGGESSPKSSGVWRLCLSLLRCQRGTVFGLLGLLDRNEKLCPLFHRFWRTISHGRRSTRGSLFVATILSVVETSRQQGRHVLEFLTACCQAALAKA